MECQKKEMKLAQKIREMNSSQGKKDESIYAETQSLYYNNTSFSANDSV